MAALYRYIDGGVAQFGPECEILDFTSSPETHLTAKVTVQTSSNTVLIVWPPLLGWPLRKLKKCLERYAGPLRFCRKINHTKAPGDCGTLLGFCQTEHALKAIAWLKSRSDIFQGSEILYTVCYTAPERIIDTIVLSKLIKGMLEPWKSEVLVEWDTQLRDGNSKLRVSSTRKDKVALTKETIDTYFTGHVVTEDRDDHGHHELWLEFFATPSGENWLRDLSREYGCVIVSDKPQQRLRIYSPNNDEEHCMQTTGKELLEVYLSKLLEHTIPLKDTFQSILARGLLAKAQELIGQANVSLDVVKHALVLRCTRKQMHDLRARLDLPHPQVDIPQHAICIRCSMITPDIKLSPCNHVMCRKCFDAGINLSNSYAQCCKMRCLDCGKQMALSDLLKYVPASILDKWLETCFKNYISANPDLYRRCPRPKCSSVYPCNDNGPSKIWTCRTCFAQICMLCHIEQHFPQTCEENAAYLKTTLCLDKERCKPYYEPHYEPHWIITRKRCPECKEVSMQDDRYNHVVCGMCQTHICWLEMKAFETREERYVHCTEVQCGDVTVGKSRMVGQKEEDEVAQDNIADSAEEKDTVDEGDIAEGTNDTSTDDEESLIGAIRNYQIPVVLDEGSSNKDTSDRGDSTESTSGTSTDDEESLVVAIRNSRMVGKRCGCSGELSMLDHRMVVVLDEISDDSDTDDGKQQQAVVVEDYQ
jgi:hypothetical protein